MSQYNPNKHHRRSIRLQGYDYSQAGLYFITICCQNRAHLFGEVINGEMHLNAFGEIAWSEWFATEEIRVNCRIHESVVMPDHLHGIIEIIVADELVEGELVEGELPFAPTTTTIGLFKSPSQTIGSIVRGFKIAVIKKIKEKIVEGELQFAPTNAPTNAPTVEIIQSLDFKIWQRNYYERIIRNEEAYRRISQYIRNNPKKWTEDRSHKR